MTNRGRWPGRETLDWVKERGALRLPAPVFGPRPQRSADQAEQTVLVTTGGEQVKAGARALTILAALAFFYSLYFARQVILPVVMAVLLSFLLRSSVRWLKRRGIAEPYGAALVMLSLVVVLSASLVLLAGPARSWLTRAPTVLADVEAKVRRVIEPLTRWQTLRANSQPASATRSKRAPVPVVVANPLPDTMLVPNVGPTILRRAVGGLSAALITFISVIFLAYFLLASGDLFMRKLLKVLPRSAIDGNTPVQVSDDVESAVSRYLLTAVLINAGLGVATWAVLWLLDMPNAGLWGVMAAILNFVPYLGALLTLIVLATASFAVFDTTGQALGVPAAFLVLNLIESNVVTPILMGRHFPLNPAALFIGILFWQFVWGVPGAILAVPMMVTIKILCDAIPSLQPYGEFLGP